MRVRKEHPNGHAVPQCPSAGVSCPAPCSYGLTRQTCSVAGSSPCVQHLPSPEPLLSATSPQDTWKSVVTQQLVTDLAGWDLTENSLFPSIAEFVLNGEGREGKSPKLHEVQRKWRGDIR